ncbi:MAG: hypothetical protein FJ253_05250 [Phycisphaerae bacterium]|nr:hypothetical protein [Phycisphaerae bacterium]
MGTTATNPTYEQTLPIGANAARAWSELTEPAAMREWLDDRVEVELRVGGRFAFGGRRTPTFGNGESKDQVITALDPGRSISFRWWWAGSPTSCELIVEPVDERSSRIRVRHDLGADIAGIPAHSQRYLLRDFWHVTIGNLESFLRTGRAAVMLDHTAPSKDATAAIEIDASIERTWRTLTDPAEMRRWLEPDAELGLAPRAELRIGGAYSFGWQSDGAPMGPTTILELDPPRRLRHGWHYDGDSSDATEWTLEPIGRGRTRLAVRQIGVAHERERHAYASGWGSFLFDIALAAHAGGVAPARAGAASTKGSHGS